MDDEEDSCMSDIDADTHNNWKEQRKLELGFTPQRDIVYNNLLPYKSDLDEESTRWFKEIKYNLGKAVATRELRPGVFVWISRLNKYIRLYSLKFPVEDHVSLIRLLFSLLTSPDMEPGFVNHVAGSLYSLLKKVELLTPDQLTLDWRPLFSLQKRFVYTKYPSLGLLNIPHSLPNNIRNVIRVCRPYFPLDATKEMMEDWRPLMCPLDVTFGEAVSHMALFLPTNHAYLDADRTYKIWLDEMTEFWKSCGNKSSWEPQFMSLLARLSSQTTGLIDWNPYLPFIFSRVEQMFHLPVKFKKMGTGAKGSPMDDYSAARWIVTTLGRGQAGQSGTQTYLTKLFGSIDSYFHPANIGRHCEILTGFMNKLTNMFVQRINRERYKKPEWGYIPPKEYCLTDEDITIFVETLKPAALQSMWSKLGFLDAGVTLQNLATLRPELILPTLTDRFTSALEVITEPHKLTASLHSMIGVSRSLVTYSKFYPQGQVSVLPLLFSTLPGIDTNDPRKSMLTFQFIATYATLIPFVDFSTASDHHNLTEEQHQISLQSSHFDDFVADFCDRCFAIIENSKVLQTRAEVANEDMRVSREDIMTNVSMASTLQTILMQSSLQVYKVALNKVKSFITGRILECKVSGKIASGLVKCLVRVRPEFGLKTLVPSLCDSILASVEQMSGTDLESQTKFELQILSKIVSVPGRFLLPYVSIITEVLDKTLPFLAKEDEEMSGALLKNTLRALTQYCPTDYKSNVKGFDRPLSEYLPLDDWGATVSPKDIDIDWNIPDKAMINEASSVLVKYLALEQDKLSSWMAGNRVLSKEELKHSVTVILNLVQGVGSQLPFWGGQPIQHQHSETNMEHHKHVVYIGDNLEITFNGENIRLMAVQMMHKLLHHIIAEFPDRTKSLTTIVSVLQASLFWNGVTKEEYEARNKSFKAVKKVLENKLMGKKKNIRPIFVDRAHLQHETRLVENVNRDFTEQHRQIFTDILELATNHYSEVRIKAQDLMGKCHRHFSYSYRVVLPKLLQLLNTESGEVTHEQYKGALYVLLGHSGKSLANKNCWETFEQICPAMLTSSLSEKPSIIRVWSKLAETIFNHMDTIAVKVEVDDSIVDCGLNLWDNCSTTVPAGEKPSLDHINTGRQDLQKISEDNFERYNRIINKLCDLLESGDLHWKRYKAGVLIIATILRHDVSLPARAVKLLTNNLAHDNLEVRKTSIFIMAGVLRLQKRKHQVVMKDMPDQVQPVSPGVRQDNDWMLYKPENYPKDEESWNKPNFVHKTHWGYYLWPKEFKVYAPECDQPKLDRDMEELKPEERYILDVFHNQDLVDKIVGFFSLEERKNVDKFDSRKFMLWKGLFRNFGESALKLLKPHIERLSLAENESFQRCGAEMIGGLIRGSKHWTWVMTEKLWEWLVPLLRRILRHVTVETVGDWGTCMATASESRDPNRIHWLLEVLMEEPLRSQGSFLDSSRLYMLQGAMAQQEWRCESLLHNLNTFLGPFLNHPYHNVRERIGSILTNIYACDFDHKHKEGIISTSPKVADFVHSLLPRLEIMRTEPDPELYNFHKASTHKVELDQEFLSSLPKEFRDLISKQCPDGTLPMLPMGMVPSLGPMTPPMGNIMSPNGAGVTSPGAMFPLPGAMYSPPSGAMIPPPPGAMIPPPGAMIPPPGWMGPPPGGMAFPPGAMVPHPGAMIPPQGVMMPPLNGSIQPRPFLMRGVPPPEFMGRMPFIPNFPPSTSASMNATDGSKTSAQDSHVSADPELQLRWDERQAGVRLLQTVCKFMIGILSRNLYPLKSELFELLPMLCLNESNELEPELARDCMSALSVMSGSLISPELVPLAVEGVTNVCKSQSWKAKVCGLEFLQVQIFTNFAVFLCCPPTSSQALIDTVTSLLQDPQLEVREKAGTVLGGLVHCGFITSEQRAKMTADFICAANKKLKKWKGAEGSTPEDKAAWQNRHNQALIKRHAGVLGLCSVVSACPYDIPDHLPEVLIVLGDHLHDPNPIPATVKRVLQDFKRTHQDNWTEHKERFTEDQLNMLTDLLVSPSYYA